MQDAEREKKDVIIPDVFCSIVLTHCVFVSQDTNPIFLFNKEMILCDRAPTITKTTFSIENEMELKVEESLMMPAVFHTVASRTQLAVVTVLFVLVQNLLSQNKPSMLLYLVSSCYNIK